MTVSVMVRGMLEASVSESVRVYEACERQGEQERKNVCACACVRACVAVELI